MRTFSKGGHAVFRWLGISLLVAGVVGWTSSSAQEKAAPSDSLGAAGDSASASAAISSHVARAVFTTAVTDREPVDEIAALKTGVEKIYFFSEIVQMEGKTITHRWLHNGEKTAEVTFTIGGPKWRVYSSKTLAPVGSGTWTVEVVDGDGNTLHKASIQYEKTP